MADTDHDSTNNHLPDTDNLDQLDTLKRQMELRRTELGKTWTELSRVMYQYHSQLIERHDTYLSNLSADDQLRISKLETLLESKNNEIKKLEKANSDLETRLLEKDSEIVRLRTEVHQTTNEVAMKDSLIGKLQTQMAREALEYQTELNSLREMLQMGGASLEPVTTPNKRRRVLKPPVAAASPTNIPSTSAVSLKSETPPPSAPTDPPKPPYPDPLEPDLEYEEGEQYKLDETSEDSFYGSEYGLLEDESQMDPGLRQSLQQNRGLLSVTDVKMAAPLTSSPMTSSSLTDVTSLRLQHPGRDQLASFSIMEKMRSALCRCHICSKGFPSKWALDRHMKTHSGIKPYKCVVCEARFTEKYNATVHVMNVHRKGPDEAKYCVITVEDGNNVKVK